MSKKKLKSHCPIYFGLESFGDKWSLLIIRDILFRGKKTYREFLESEEGFATNILASRLAQLEEEGFIEKNPHPKDARQNVYSLTEKGIDLVPLILEISLWSLKYDPKSESRRITRLLELVQKNNRKISQKLMSKARKREALFPEYLD